MRHIEPHVNGLETMGIRGVDGKQIELGTIEALAVGEHKAGPQ